MRRHFSTFPRCHSNQITNGKFMNNLNGLLWERTQMEVLSFWNCKIIKDYLQVLCTFHTHPLHSTKTYPLYYQEKTCFANKTGMASHNSLRGQRTNSKLQLIDENIACLFQFFSKSAQWQSIKRLSQYRIVRARWTSSLTGYNQWSIQFCTAYSDSQQLSILLENNFFPVPQEPTGKQAKHARLSLLSTSKAKQCQPSGVVIKQVQ